MAGSEGFNSEVRNVFLICLVRFALLSSLTGFSKGEVADFLCKTVGLNYILS